VANPAALRLHVRGEPEALDVVVDETPLALGRRDTDSGVEPGIDFGPYGARRHGVSRHHADLFSIDGAVYVEDLGSRNGTFVNGERIAPYVEHRLFDGDWLRLGKLNLQVNYVD